MITQGGFGAAELDEWLARVTMEELGTDAGQARLEVAMAPRGLLNRVAAERRWSIAWNNPELGPEWLLGPGLEFAAQLEDLDAGQSVIRDRYAWPFAQIMELLVPWAATDPGHARKSLEAFAAAPRGLKSVSNAPLWASFGFAIGRDLDAQWSRHQQLVQDGDADLSGQELLPRLVETWGAVLGTAHLVGAWEQLEASAVAMLWNSEWTRRDPGQMGLCLLGGSLRSPDVARFTTWLTEQCEVAGVECDEHWTDWGSAAAGPAGTLWQVRDLIVDAQSRVRIPSRHDQLAMRDPGPSSCQDGI